MFIRQLTEFIQDVGFDRFRLAANKQNKGVFNEE